MHLGYTVMPSGPARSSAELTCMYLAILISVCARVSATTEGQALHFTTAAAPVSVCIHGVPAVSHCYWDSSDDPRSAAGWHLVMQQQMHELESLRQRASYRETDRQVLSDVWQQQHLYEDEDRLARADLYDGQGLPVAAPPEEDEAQQEAAGDTFMVGSLS